MNKTKLLLISILLSGNLVFADDSTQTDPNPSYKEIPYYLHQLETATLDDKRLEYNKIIHDAVVTADLLDKQVVKEMEPIIEKIMRAMDSNLDRPYLSGNAMYLASAVEYFEHEKLQPIIDIPESDWMDLQSENALGYKLSTYPNKILLHKSPKTLTIAENTNIHEAVISRDGAKVAYFRTLTETSKESEIWVVNIQKMKAKKVATVPSCYTILFSPEGNEIYFQESLKTANAESAIYRVSSGGGKPKFICTGSLLQTLIEKGKYKGGLIVYKKYKHHMGISVQDCPYAYTPSGKGLGRLKNGPCK